VAAAGVARSSVATEVPVIQVAQRTVRVMVVSVGVVWCFRRCSGDPCSTLGCGPQMFGLDPSGSADRDLDRGAAG
jgi:hypothetical protein